MRNPRLGWLTDHWWLKVISLFLAIGLWFYVVGEESIEITKTVPLDILPPNEKLSVVKSSTYFLEVTFRAPRNLIPAVSSQNISAVHKVEGVEKPGDYSFTIPLSDFSLPTPAIGIVKIVPATITATLDELVVKKLPIQVELSGEPAYGYRVDQEWIELDPNAVLVEGPKAALDEMNVIKTEAVQLVGRVRTFRRTVRIQQLDGIRVVGEGITEVQIPIKPEFAEKEFPGVSVKPLGALGRNRYVEFKPEEIAVVLKGPRALLDQLQIQNVLVYADVGDLKEGVHQVPVRFILPPDLVLKGEAPLVSVEVKST